MRSTGEGRCESENERLLPYNRFRSRTDPHSWQVAYTWAFLVKFGLRDKIKGLETPEE